MTKSCQTCQSVSEDNTGPICRLRPPVTLITPRGDVLTVWPAVALGTDWCDAYTKQLVEQSSTGDEVI